MQEALGRHIIAEFYNCPASKLNEVIAIEKAMVDSAQQSGATVINSTFHHFAPFGVSGVVVIQESHLAIHTWPEYGFAAVDLFTCGNTVSPWVALEALKKSLGAGHISAMEMRRGQPEMLGNMPLPNQEHSLPSEELMTHARKITRDLWFTERAGEIALSVKHEGELLFQKQSAWQKVEVLQTSPMGQMLVLDGVIATTSLDGFVINEMTVHPACLAHTHPQKALIIGGGDGGTAQELLKHPSIEEIILIERDPVVIEAAQKWISLKEALDALSNPKVSIRLADAHEELRKIPSNWADIVIVDAYNPAEMNDGQWHNAFFQAVKKVLNSNGIAVFQMGSPWLKQKEYQHQYQSLCYNFGAQNISVCQASVPSYPTGLWTFAYACLGNYSPLKVDRQRQEALCRQFALQYYNEEIQQQMWALPNFLKNICKPPTSLPTGS